MSVTQVSEREAEGVEDALLGCPRCKTALIRKGDSLACRGCGATYPILEGMPCFAPTDEFYDNYAAAFAHYKASPGGLKEQALKVLPFWSWREWRFWRRVVPPCERLLDIGCGRGRQIFEERAKETVGFDTSLAFLRECAHHYDRVVSGRVPELPFQDASFDAVVTSHVLGHVPVDLKESLVKEIARVVRPGGTTSHIIETDSVHPAVAAAKASPEAYRRQFIDKHGHIGLEPAEQAIERFERHGFRLELRRLVDAIVPSVLNYRTFFAVPDLAAVPSVRVSNFLSELCSKSVVANAAYEVGMGAFHFTIEQWLGKPRNAQFILVSFRRA